MAWIHHMQEGGGGRYIPGFSSVVKGTRLDQDVRDWREGFTKHIDKVQDFAKKSKMLSWVGGKAAKIGAHALGFGGAGDIAEKGGEWLGASDTARKLFGIKAPTDFANKTGLGKKQVQALEDYESGIGKGLQGEALGGAGSLLKSMALSKIPALGSAEIFGSELRSGIGKSLMDKYGLNIGKSFVPEKLTQSAKSFLEDYNPMEGTPIEDMTSGASAAGQSFKGLFGLNTPQTPTLQMPSMNFSQGPIDFSQGLEGMTGWGYGQLGGDTEDIQKRGSLLDAFREADLNREDIAKKYRPRAQQRRAFEEEMVNKALGELGGFGHAEDARRMENVYQQSLGDMDRGNIKSMQDIMGDLKWSKAGEIGEDKRRIATRGARGEEPLEPLRGLAGEDIGNHSGGPLALPKELRSSIPAGSYQGDILERIPEQDMQKFLGGLGGGQEDILSALEALVGDRDTTRMSPYEREWYDTLPQEEQWGDPRKARLESLMKKYGGMQMGGMAGAVSNPIPYNLGGSVYQQPMQYQLGGLLKYRSPM